MFESAEKFRDAKSDEMYENICIYMGLPAFGWAENVVLYIGRVHLYTRDLSGF